MLPLCAVPLQTAWSAERINAKWLWPKMNLQSLSLTCGCWQLHHMTQRKKHTRDQTKTAFDESRPVRALQEKEATSQIWYPAVQLVGRHTLAESIEEESVRKYLHDSLIQVKHSHLFEWGIMWWHLVAPPNTNQKCFLKKCFQNKYNNLCKLLRRHICN